MIPPNQMIERVLDRDAASMNFDWVLMADRPDMYDEISFFFIIIIIFWDKRLEYDEIS